MAQKEKAPQGEATLDNETLLENMRGLELENKTLKEQLAAEQEKSQKAQQMLEEAQANSDDQKALSDLQSQIDELTNERNELAGQLEDAHANNNKGGDEDKTIAELQAAFDTLNATNKENLKKLVKAEEDVEEAKRIIAELEKENKGKTKYTVTLHPFAYNLMTLLCKKLSALYDRDVTHQMVVEDYFLKYNCWDQWTEWFHPFLLTDEEILVEARKVNPNIKSIKDLRKAANINLEEHED